MTTTNDESVSSSSSSKNQNNQQQQLNNSSNSENNDNVVEDRTVLKNLLQSAINGDATKLQTIVNDYVENKNKNNNNKVITPYDVLKKFKDVKKRTALHLACQSLCQQPSSSSSSNTTSSTKTNSNDDDKDESNDNGNDSNDSDSDIITILLNNESWFPNNNNDNNLGELLKLKDKDGLTPIMYSAQHKDPKIGERRVTSILQKSAAAQKTNNNIKLGLARSKAGGTPLHYAAGAGATPKTIKLLYESGHIAINTFSLKGGTPLHWACSCCSVVNNSSKNKNNNNYIQTIDALIKCGADVNAQNDTIPSPLILLLSSSSSSPNNDKLVKRLLSCEGISIPGIITTTPEEVGEGIEKRRNNKTIYYDDTIFHMAAKNNLVETLEILLEKTKAAKISDGESNDNDNNNKALSVSSNVLIIKQKNRDGKTALDLAAQHGHIKCVQLLLPYCDSNNNNSSNNNNVIVTEDDAKTYIEQYNVTNMDRNDSSTIATPTQQQQQKKKKISSAKNTSSSQKQQTATQKRSTAINTPKDETEAKAQKKAIEIQSLPDPSQECINKALQFKKKGNSHFSKKEWSVAIKYYSKAIEINPKEPAFYSNRSACYISLNNNHAIEKALEDAIIAQILKPKWSKAYYRISVARLHLNRYEDAAMSAFEGLKYDKDNIELKKILQKCVQQGRQAHRKQQQQRGSKEEKQEEETDTTKATPLNS